MTSILQQEILEQPVVLRRLLDEQAERSRQVARAIAEFDPTFMAIAARGTSDNAARYAQYLFGSMVRLPVALCTPSLHTLYETPPRFERAVVVGISQSGQAQDVTRVITDARAQGALTVSITNFDDSPLAQAADYHLPLLAGVEESLAATKTYTAQLATIALLVVQMTDSDEMRQALQHLPDAVQQTIDLSESVAEWAQRYRYMPGFAAIGRGYNYATAYEVSLKIKELCYINGDGYSEADFQHGPIAMIDPGFPVITVAPQGSTLPNMLDFLQLLQERSVERLVISNDEAALQFAHKAMRIPAIAEWLSPIVSIVPAQMLALHLATAMGHQVDKPRGLRKVTITN